MLHKAIIGMALLLVGGTAFAQKKQSKLTIELGANCVWNPSGNRASHLPLAHQETYPSLVPAFHTQILYSVGKATGIGLEGSSLFLRGD